MYVNLSSHALVPSSGAYRCSILTLYGRSNSSQSPALKMVKKFYKVILVAERNTVPESKQITENALKLDDVTRADLK